MPCRVSRRLHRVLLRELRVDRSFTGFYSSKKGCHCPVLEQSCPLDSFLGLLVAPSFLVVYSTVGLVLLKPACDSALLYQLRIHGFRV